MWRFPRHRFFERRKKISNEEQCDSLLYENYTQYLTEKEELADDEYYKYIKYVVTYVYAEEGIDWNDELEEDFNDLMVQFIKFDDEINQVRALGAKIALVLPSYEILLFYSSWTSTTIKARSYRNT